MKIVNKKVLTFGFKYCNIAIRSCRFTFHMHEQSKDICFNDIPTREKYINYNRLVPGVDVGTAIPEPGGVYYK